MGLKTEQASFCFNPINANGQIFQVACSGKWRRPSACKLKLMGKPYVIHWSKIWPQFIHSIIQWEDFKS